MKHAVTRELYEYWNKLRGDRLSPERGEIDPTAIRSILADTFILEVDRGCFSFRLSGTRTNALFMRDLKGSPFLDLWRTAEQRDVAGLLACVCDDAIGVVAGVLAAPPGRTPIELELLLLPVRHHGKTHARMLGCLAPGRLATWIGLVPATCLLLQALRILRPGAPAGAWPEGDPEPAFSRSDEAQRRLGSIRRRHLFVHPSRDLVD